MRNLSVKTEDFNGAYKVLMDSLPEKRKAQLRDAQRKWIEFRDANCEFYYVYKLRLDLTDGAW